MNIHFFALHIPDGFLSLPVSVVGWVMCILLLGYSLRQTQRQLQERQIPLMGILAAFVFAAQMINFPVAGGTSGHLLGGTLVAIFLGPWAMTVVMACVIGVQAFLFQDGGLLALGFNIINMGAISGFVGYAIYRLIRKAGGQSNTTKLIGAGIGAWLGVVLAAAATSLQLAISGTSSLNVALPAMISVHILIGLGEALITVAAISFVQRTRPDLIDQSAAVSGGKSSWIAVGMVIALVVAFASPLADSNPDGLERVAEDHGFLATAQDPSYTIMPDYTVPFIESEIITTIAAGIIGVLAVSGIGYSVAKISKRRDHNPQEQSPTAVR